MTRSKFARVSAGLPRAARRHRRYSEKIELRTVMMFSGVDLMDVDNTMAKSTEEMMNA